MASDKTPVTFKDLQNYTDKLKSYIDYKLVPVPSDCEQLKQLIYSPAIQAHFVGWSLPAGFTANTPGQKYEYYFVEDNKVVAHCSGLQNTTGSITYTWLDDTCCPDGISFFGAASQAKSWGMVCSYSFQSTVTIVTNTAGTEETLYTINNTYMKNILNACGRYTVYARKK